MFRELLKRALAQTPYRIIRDHGRNRFDAFGACFVEMKTKGYEPSLIIDGGANVGAFSVQMKSTFPSAQIHMVEPQAACLPTLRALASSRGFHLHELALSDHCGTVPFNQSEEASTGAAVWQDASTSVLCATIDHLFAERAVGSQCFIKLDLQGHDLQALRGAEETLKHTDAVLTEVAFRDETGTPFDDVVCFMRSHGFRLWDFAALCGSFDDLRLMGGDVIFARIGGALR